MKIKSFADQCRARFVAKLADNLDDAGAEIALRVRGVISVQGPPRSTPGNPPHMDTRKLIASYGHDTDKEALVTRIGSDVDYSVYMETGTPKMAPRPHLTDTFINSADDAARIVAKP